MTADAPLRPVVDALADLLADALTDARRAGEALPMAPWLGRVPDIDAAYEVQQRVAAKLGWFDGGMPRHWKSGGPSRNAPLTHAGLPPPGVYQMPDRQPARLAGHAFHQRGIEAEVALRTRRDITADEVARWPGGKTPPAADIVDAMTAAIEVVDLRWQMPTPDGHDADVALLKLADQQAHGALVLGDWVPLDAARDWSRQRCELRIGHRPARSFEGTHSLGDPTWLLPAWLAHATRQGRTVPAGTVVTTGTWCGLCDAAEGDLVEATLPGLGTVALRF